MESLQKFQGLTSRIQGNLSLLGASCRALRAKLTAIRHACAAQMLAPRSPMCPEAQCVNAYIPARRRRQSEMLRQYIDRISGRRAALPAGGCIERACGRQALELASPSWLANQSLQPPCGRSPELVPEPAGHIDNVQIQIRPGLASY